MTQKFRYALTIHRVVAGNCLEITNCDRLAVKATPLSTRRSRVSLKGGASR
jgi:antitoxin (DNA-binding transcriptional repressor) of toxin-antitoxin stability system